MNIKISIVTVCYNDLNALKQTSASIVNQSYPNVEWLVADGGSNDGSYEFLSTNDSITKFISEKDNGIYDAMNKGTLLATGNYVIFLNAGDIFYRSDSLIKLVDAINGADVILLGAYFTCKDKPTRYRAPRNLSSVWHSVPANHQATVFSRNVLGVKPYNDEYKVCGDYELIAKLYKNNVTSQVVDQPLVSFSLGGVSTFSTDKLAKEAMKVQKEVLLLPIYVVCFSWLRRQCAMQANLLLCKISGVEK